MLQDMTGGWHEEEAWRGEVLSVKVCFLLSGDTSADVCHSYPVLLFSGVESQQYGFECSKC